ncbi:hypothetical protein CCMSSC00406_0004996 [Pleurotus cornucopiae]|uniref:Uncharacterized protein n=1 Tax=Pleurotus cornucopiae TaxID=5321 RepID=A0ACB7J7B1_PLECO|nr:hypothetical protein CCMSSC00406_0004996 [Pleurotus cornucopiae]
MSPTAIPGATDEYRLPLDLKPTHYEVTIQTDLEKQTFSGFVKAHLDVVKETSKVVLNTAELELGTASVYSDALQKEQFQSDQSFDATQERAVFHFPTPLPAGSKAQFQISFSGPLTGSMTGYYKSSWEEEGKLKYYALTQFEPTSARHAFPCWDEPLLKATFEITMVSRANTVSLSNMPSVSEEVYKSGNVEADSALGKLLSTLDHSEEWKITKFQPTPPMSSYIVAWANGPFAHLEKIITSPLTGKELPLRMYATPDIIHQAQFALDVTAKVLPIYEQVFDVAYPLPKLDTLVASDFDAGAMENWGLITGRTIALLFNPERGDLAAMKQVATTQSHEVAHMWFGNITTMEWWNYLYLNEGFATLMGEVIIADKVFPEWKVDSEFISGHLNRALALDAKLSSHPIEVDCPDANHINQVNSTFIPKYEVRALIVRVILQIFDALSYSKAASVLRMLSNYVGEDLFLKGVSIYLKKKLYANSVTTDLWQGISESTGVDVVKLMDNWITKIGFPVLTVTETPEGINVRQDRFLETGHADPKDNETIWNVPLSILSVDANGTATVDKKPVLEEREKFYPLDTSKTFKLNAGTTGVYRVLYTPERLAKIAEEAAKEPSPFSLNDRIGLVHDSMQLARAGHAKLSSALTLVSGLRNEQEYLVWSGIAENLGSLASIWWENDQAIELINNFRRALFVPLVDKLGFEYADDESADIRQLRTLAISGAAQAGEPKVVAELRARFAEYMKTGEDAKIPADLQRIIYSMAVRHGGRAEYDAVMQINDKPKAPSARTAAIVSLCQTRDDALLQETFQYILNKSRDQDVVYFFRGLETNVKARRPAAQFFKDNYDTLYKRFEGNFTLKYLVEMSFNSLSTEKDYKEIVDFFADKDKSKYNLSLSQVLDTIRAKIAYLERSTDDMVDWLAKWQNGSKL